jgi:hypothetical protein
MSKHNDEDLVCESCGNDLSIYQLETSLNNNNVVMQVGNEKRDVTEFVTKSSTQSGAKVNAGASSSGPNVSGGGFLQNVSSLEDKDATSTGKSFSITQSSGHTVQITWLNPDNADPNNDQYFSGCMTSDCQNNIGNDVKHIIDNSKSAQQLSDLEDISSSQSSEKDTNKEFDNSLETFLDGVDASEMSLNGIDPRNEAKDSSITGSAVNRVRSSAGTAVNKARSGASSAITRSREGVSNTVDRVKQRLGSSDPDTKQDTDHTLDADQPAPETNETTIRVSPGDTDPNVSYTNDGDLNMAFHDGTDTDTTVLHVAAAGDEQVPLSSTEGEFSTTLNGGEMQLSPETDDAVQMSPGTDGDMSFSINDGSMVHVAPGDDDTDVVPGNDGDFHMAFGDGHATDGPNTEPDNPRAPEPDTTRSTGPNTTQTTGSNNSHSNEPDNSQANEIPEAFRDQKPNDVIWKTDDELEEIRQREGIENGAPERDTDGEGDHGEPGGPSPR